MTASVFSRIDGGSATSPGGFTAGAAHAGLKADGALDVALLVSATSCATAGVFTKNAMRAAPVVYDAEMLADRPGRIRAVAMNARVANACTGAAGLEAARAMARAAEEAAGLPPLTALVLSTGVIGVPLPVDKVSRGLQDAAKKLSPEGGAEAARAIMTTDTRPKHCAVRLETPHGPIVIGGMAKGAGMIHPDMATLLAVLTTDAVSEPGTLRGYVRVVEAGAVELRVRLPRGARGVRTWAGATTVRHRLTGGEAVFRLDASPDAAADFAVTWRAR